MAGLFYLTQSLQSDCLLVDAPFFQDILDHGFVFEGCYIRKFGHFLLLFDERGDIFVMKRGERRWRGCWKECGIQTGCKPFELGLFIAHQTALYVIFLKVDGEDKSQVFNVLELLVGC